MERINILDYRFREENENTLLAFNVITSEMIFLHGNTKEYIKALLNNEEYNGVLNEKNFEILKTKKIIIGS